MFLGMASRVYGLAVALRNRRYNRNPALITRFDVPTISIGNITAGGTGKTPMAALICQFLGIWGYAPAILTRGYMRRRNAPSDEVLELRKRLPGVPVIVNPNRVLAARMALDQEASALVLDDGFQHRRLHRHADLVLIDALDPFGGNALLPRGLLREPLSSLARATAVIITRCNQTTREHVHAIERQIRQHFTGQIVRSEIQPTGVVDAHKRSIQPQGQTVLPVCAVGNPHSFLSTCTELGLEACEPLTWPDHHSYTEADLQRIRHAAQRASAAAVVTTNKDWVKLKPLLHHAARPTDPPFWIVPVQHTFTLGGQSFLAELRDLCMQVRKP